MSVTDPRFALVKAKMLKTLYAPLEYYIFGYQPIHHESWQRRPRIHLEKFKLLSKTSDIRPLFLFIWPKEILSLFGQWEISIKWSTGYCTHFLKIGFAGGGFYFFYINQGNKAEKDRRIVRKKFYAYKKI